MRSSSGRFGGLKFPGIGNKATEKDTAGGIPPANESDLAGSLSSPDGPIGAGQRYDATGIGHGQPPSSPSAAGRPGGHLRLGSFGLGSGNGTNTGSISTGSGGDDKPLGKLIKDKVAHTTLLPNLIGTHSLRELQDLITSEKGIMQSSDRLSNEITQACDALSHWGSNEGPDLSDVLGHAGGILGHLSAAFAVFAQHESDVRILWKGIRTKEEELEDLLKKRKSLGNRAEKEEKKLAKMGQENKNLMSQTELLQSLRDQMKQMDTDILTDEAKLGDYKRRTMKEALALKFGGCLELAEKMTIVGELGKLLIEEIPLEETPPGYGRAPYQGYEQTARLSAEATRCIKEVQFDRPVVKALPPGLPQARQLAPLQPPSTSNLAARNVDDYRRTAAAYSDDPHTQSPTRATHNTVLAGGYTEGQLSTPRTEFDVNGQRITTGSHVMFDAPTSPPPAQTARPRDGPPLTSQLDPYDSPRSLEAATVPTSTTAPWVDASSGTRGAGADSAIAGAHSGALAPPLPLNVGQHGVQDAHVAEPAIQPVAAPAAPVASLEGILQEDGPVRTLTIGQWSIQTAKKPILNAAEIDAVTADLAIPLPEMTFGNNHLTMTYSSGPAGMSGVALQYAFSALHGLASVASGEGWEERIGGAVQVSMAEHWNQNRTTSSFTDEPISNKPTNPFDWTYSSTYAGTLNPPEYEFVPCEETIPMELLARQDPVLDRIIFYDDIPLFEDELHDNGQSIYNVRIRVMPHSFFILARIFVRVDGVLFRLFDVRVYHEFGTDKILRETTGYEGSYESVKEHLESPNDLAPLSDPNFVSRVLPSLMPLSSTGKPWPGIGSRKEVLRLPVNTDASPLSPTKTSIMDRARPIPRATDSPDGGYEKASWSARDHTRYVEPGSVAPSSGTTAREASAAPPTEAVEQLREDPTALDVPPPYRGVGAVPDEKFYTPAPSPRPMELPASPLANDAVAGQDFHMGAVHSGDELPRKRILSAKHLEAFQASQTHQDLMTYIMDLNDSVVGLKLSDAGESSHAVRNIMSMLDEIDRVAESIPPVDNKASRFGNPAFKEFYDKVKEMSPELHRRLFEDSSAESENCKRHIPELCAYFDESWGNRTRIDYGSGMELNFLCWLLCLRKLNYFSNEDNRDVVLQIFWRYIKIMRRLQSTYWLEPAGSHGVWGLDDYHFLPFLWGSGQLKGHKHLRPKAIHDKEILEAFGQEYMYLACIQFIDSIKTASLRWHSPMLDDISAVKTWDKVNEGMIKMYKAEVLGKLPVVQHFLFGSLLPFPEGVISAEEEAALQSAADRDAHGHAHGPGESGWTMDCCGIPVPSAFAAAAAVQEGNPSGGSQSNKPETGLLQPKPGLRPIPFD